MLHGILYRIFTLGLSYLGFQHLTTEGCTTAPLLTPMVTQKTAEETEDTGAATVEMLVTDVGKADATEEPHQTVIS